MKDVRRRRDPVVVISHALWTRAFASDPAAIGRSITVDGAALTVIGVAPPDFHGSASGLALDAYVPITMQKSVTSGDRLGGRALRRD
jgi:riboflavin synthase alpha subunit